MSASSLNSLSLSGSETDVAAFVASSSLPAEIDWTHRRDGYAEGSFIGVGKNGGLLVETVSKDFPDLAIVVSTVDVATGLVEAAVFRGSDCVARQP